MWWKLIYSSFRRDFRKKMVALSAVVLATCLATFLLNWSLNLGDKIQEDLRAYGANIVIHPLGESLTVTGDTSEALLTDRYLRTDDLKGLKQIFWKNQIVAFVPLLPQKVFHRSKEIQLVGTLFGGDEATADLRKTAPYLAIDGRWPQESHEAVAGTLLAKRLGWEPGMTVELEHGASKRRFLITGIIESGGVEDDQLFGLLSTVQDFTGHSGEFKQLMVSALVNSADELFHKHERDPGLLTPVEMERYSCTPYITVVSNEIAGIFQGAEPRIVRRISQSEEKIASKVNWLMVLVTLAALLASSLTTTSTVTAIILERRKELALMKAIGSHNAFLVAYLFTEILLLGLLGSFIGFTIGSFLSVGLSHSMFQASFELKPIVLPLVIAAGGLIILGGSLWPLRLAIAVEPSTVLKDL